MVQGAVQPVTTRRPDVRASIGRRWLEQATDQITGGLVDLDPDSPVSRRASDGRSLRIEPTAAHFTTKTILAQEEDVLAWAALAQLDDPSPSTTVRTVGLDPLQAAAAASVAGHDRLTLVVGPAGAGKTRMLAAGVADLHRHDRLVFGLAPTAKGARVLSDPDGYGICFQWPATQETHDNWVKNYGIEPKLVT